MIGCSWSCCVGRRRRRSARKSGGVACVGVGVSSRRRGCGSGCAATSLVCASDGGGGARRATGDVGGRRGRRGAALGRRDGASGRALGVIHGAGRGLCRAGRRRRPWLCVVAMDGLALAGSVWMHFFGPDVAQVRHRQVRLGSRPILSNTIFTAIKPTSTVENTLWKECARHVHNTRDCSLTSIKIAYMPCSPCHITYPAGHPNRPRLDASQFGNLVCPKALSGTHFVSDRSNYRDLPGVVHAGIALGHVQPPQTGLVGVGIN